MATTLPGRDVQVVVKEQALTAAAHFLCCVYLGQTLTWLSRIFFVV